MKPMTVPAEGCERGEAEPLRLFRRRALQYSDPSSIGGSALPILSERTDGQEARVDHPGPVEIYRRPEDVLHRLRRARRPGQSQPEGARRLFRATGAAAGRVSQPDRQRQRDGGSSEAQRPHHHHVLSLFRAADDFCASTAAAGRSIRATPSGRNSRRCSRRIRAAARSSSSRSTTSSPPAATACR